MLGRGGMSLLLLNVGSWWNVFAAAQGWVVVECLCCRSMLGRGGMSLLSLNVESWWNVFAAQC